MERLSSLDEYKALLMQYKAVCRRGYNNNFMSFSLVKRYIELGRIWYMKKADSLLLFTDEETYYRLYVQLSPETDAVDINKMEKPILVRNIYHNNHKTEVLVQFEKLLKDQGFSLCDKSLQIVANPLEMRESIQKKYQKASSFVTRAGLYIAYAKEEHIDAILKLREEEPILKYYQFPFQTKEEVCEKIKNGYCRCVFNADGELCAAQEFSVENNTLHGEWLAVKEEYKIKYGIGTAMAYHSFLYAIEHEIPNYYGWVVCDNEKSLNYHKSIGYEITDKFAEEWILE